MKLSGIDGSHLFGFLAAIGLHSLMDRYAQSRKQLPARMAFDEDYSAILDGVEEEAQLVDTLFDGLQRSRKYFDGDLSGIDKPSDFTGESFGKLVRLADREQACILSGFACWTGAEIHESTLCAANGASHQELIRSIRDVLALVERKHLSAALFAPWRREYEVPQQDRKSLNLGTRKPTLRLDPADERLYALRATNPTPSSTTYKTELGAQALATAAFSVLPVLPRRRPLTVGSVRNGNRVYFTWNLWSTPSTLATIRSLLFSASIMQRDVKARGVFAAFRAARVSGAKGKLSFSPSEGLWS